jgi:hypothetical protein
MAMKKDAQSLRRVMRETTKLDERRRELEREQLELMQRLGSDTIAQWLREDLEARRWVATTPPLPTPASAT